MKVFSQAEENYLKAIYALETNATTGVSTNMIAEKIQAKASSVTDMVQKLSEKELVLYKKYQGVKLSAKGRKIASSIVRKHRLWETFLVEKLHFNWDEVHDIAEQLEHIQSEKLVQHLDSFLGYPTHDPHGDPIPDTKGEIMKVEKVKLSELHEKEEAVLIGVEDSSDSFLKYLNKKKISIGDTLLVTQREPFDGSLQLELKNKPMLITATVADNLWVKKISYDQ